jgi:dynein heavy chain
MTHKKPEKRPAEGAYVYGMFLDGARWDFDKKVLAEQSPKVLYEELPVLYLKPVKTSEQSEVPHFLCPVYKTSERKGVLATTGHSSNYVIAVKLPTDKSADHWVMRGTALLTALSE